MAPSPKFHQVVQEMLALHDRKNNDYGADADPFANFRAAETWGVPAWKHVYLRIEEKLQRLRQFSLKGELANESADDSVLDIAVLAAIAVVLFREANEKVDADA